MTDQDLHIYSSDITVEFAELLAKRMTQDGYIRNDEVIPVTLTLAVNLIEVVTTDTPARKEAIVSVIQLLLTKL